MSSEVRSIAPLASPVLTGEAERERVVSALRKLEPELRRRGVRRLRLFGSVARGEAGLASDVDLIADIDHRSVKFSLLDHAGLELDLGERLGRAVEITTAPGKMRGSVRERAERDGIELF